MIEHNDEHGGDCCGVHHLFCFDKVLTEKDEVAMRNSLNSTIGSYATNNKTCILFEVVLRDDQLSQNNNIMCKILKEFGFEKGPRWKNVNSGMYLTMFFHYKTLPEKDKPPYKW